MPFKIKINHAWFQVGFGAILRLREIHKTGSTFQDEIFWNTKKIKSSLVFTDILLRFLLLQRPVTSSPTTLEKTHYTIHLHLNTWQISIIDIRPSNHILARILYLTVKHDWIQEIYDREHVTLYSLYWVFF
jgi:hypothetical protein